MCLRDTLYEVQRFRCLGLNVIVPEYVGYGMSSGRPSEQGCYAAAEAAYDYLTGRPDIDPTKVAACGWSLGGAVAVDLALRRPIAGLALFSSFTSMADMARRSFPFLPVSLLLRHRFESDRKIPSVRCPILIGHGLSDSIVPPVMADRLEALARARVTRLGIEGADHNDFFAIGHGRIFTALDEFLGPLSQ
jgi:pimeloyl-ACP methyl ester carboxylesterase